MKSLSHTLLLASGLSLSGVGATEYDPFVPTNPAGYPTFSTILAVEEGAVNAVLRREFAKGIRYRVGSFNSSRTVRVGDYLEGTFTVDHTGMTEFSFIIHEVGIDLQRPAGASAANLVARLDFSLNIGGQFVRRYKFDWQVAGTQKPILLLDNEIILELANDIQALDPVITYQDVCSRFPGAGENTCFEYHMLIVERLKRAFRSLPIVRDTERKLTEFGTFSTRLAGHFQTSGYCKSFTQSGVACPSEIAAYETQATQYFAAMAASFQSFGYADIPEIGYWNQTLTAMESWVSSCAQNQSHPLRSACMSVTWAMMFSGKNLEPRRIYDAMKASLVSVSGLLAQGGKRIGQLPAFVFNGRIYGQFDKDRLLLGVSYDVMATPPSISYAYDAGSGFMTVSSNTGFSILSLAPVDTWFAENLLMPLKPEFVKPMRYDEASKLFKVEIDMRAALLFAYQYKWNQGQFCPQAGCPIPSYSNMAGTSKNVTVVPTIGTSAAFTQTVNVQL